MQNNHFHSDLGPSADLYLIKNGIEREKNAELCESLRFLKLNLHYSYWAVSSCSMIPNTFPSVS